MCGIAYVKRFDGKSADGMVLKRYHKQKTRGQQGFGYVAIEQGRIVQWLRSETEKDITTGLKGKVANEVMFHHRFPTSTENYAHCAHPIKVAHASLNHDYYVIHNGMVWDDATLKAKHEKLGYIYTTEVFEQTVSPEGTVLTQKSLEWNDSEALAIELAMDLDSEAKGVSVKGSIAFVALQVAKNSKQVLKTYFGRNDGSPLVMQFIDGQYVSVTSEGTGKELAENVLYSIGLDNKLDAKEYQVGEAFAKTKPSAGYHTVYDGRGYAGSVAEANIQYDDTDPLDDYVTLCEQYEDTQARLTKAEAAGEEDEYTDCLQEKLAEIGAKLEAIEEAEIKQSILQG